MGNWKEGGKEEPVVELDNFVDQIIVRISEVSLDIL